MTANFPRLPIRFLPEQAELLKSLSEDVDLEAGAKEAARVRSNVRKSQVSLLSKAVAPSGNQSDDTDWKLTETPPTVPATIQPQFRAPMDRNIGNVLFRRNPDGSLDMDAAKHVVIDIIHRVKDQGPLTELDKVTLGVMFPTLFAFVDPRLATSLMAVHLRLSEWEVQSIVELVAAHFKAELNYNAGLGGGSVPGRETTRV
jgi:hypothetical protein